MYIVLELQTNASGQVAVIKTEYNDISVAKQKYYSILSAASVSNVAKHSALILDNEGKTVMRECIFHRGAGS